MRWALQFLTEFQVVKNALLERIITRDESWINFWMPETKEQSKMWKETAQEAPQKFKTVLSAGKVTLTVFWYHGGPIYWEFEDDTKFRVCKGSYFESEQPSECYLV